MADSIRDRKTKRTDGGCWSWRNRELPRTEFGRSCRRWSAQSRRLVAGVCMARIRKPQPRPKPNQRSSRSSSLRPSLFSLIMDRPTLTPGRCPQYLGKAGPLARTCTTMKPFRVARPVPSVPRPYCRPTATPIIGHRPAKRYQRQSLRGRRRATETMLGSPGSPKPTDQNTDLIPWRCTISGRLPANHGPEWIV